MEYLPWDRIDPKHFRWHAEVVQGGCLIIYKPGTGAMHRLPDALSRHPEIRDALNLARIGEMSQWRKVIRGLQEAMADGADEEPDPTPYQFSPSEIGEERTYNQLGKEIDLKFEEPVDIRLDLFD